MKNLMYLVLIILVTSGCHFTKISQPTGVIRNGDNTWEIVIPPLENNLNIVEIYSGIKNKNGILSGLVCGEFLCVAVDQNFEDGFYFIPGIPGIEIYEVIRNKNNIIKGKYLATTDCNGYFFIETKGSKTLNLIFSYPSPKDGSLYYEFNPTINIDDRNVVKKNFINCP